MALLQHGDKFQPSHQYHNGYKWMYLTPDEFAAMPEFYTANSLFGQIHFRAPTPWPERIHAAQSRGGFSQEDAHLAKSMQQWVNCFPALVSGDEFLLERCAVLASWVEPGGTHFDEVRVVARDISERLIGLQEK